MIFFRRPHNKTWKASWLRGNSAIRFDCAGGGQIRILLPRGDQQSDRGPADPQLAGRVHHRPPVQVILVVPQIY